MAGLWPLPLAPPQLAGLPFGEWRPLQTQFWEKEG